MYVPGVAVWRRVDIIDRWIINNACCVFALFRNTVLRCAAGQITIDSKAHLPSPLFVRAAF